MTRIDNPGTGIIFLDKVRKSLSQQTHGGKNIHAVIRDWGLGTLLIFIFGKYSTVDIRILSVSFSSSELRNIFHLFAGQLRWTHDDIIC